MVVDATKSPIFHKRTMVNVEKSKMRGGGTGNGQVVVWGILTDYDRF